MSERILANAGIRQMSQKGASADVDWLYTGLIPRRGFGVLAGESGVGKSTLAVDLAISAATGTAWAGCQFGSVNEDDEILDRGTSGVLFIDGEGQASIDARLKVAYDMKQANSADGGADDRHTENLPIWIWDMIGAEFGEASLSSWITRAVQDEYARRFREKLGVTISLIVVDTLMAMPGATNENDNGVMQERVNALKTLGKAMGATVLAITHLKRGSKEIRGATSLYNASDFVLRVDQHAARSNTLSLVHVKARHSSRQPSRHFRLGEPLTSNVMPYEESPPRIIDWLDVDNSDPPPSKQRNPRLFASKYSDVRRNVEEMQLVSHESNSLAFDTYIEALKVAGYMRDGRTAARPLVRSVFDHLYLGTDEAKRKAFTRSDLRARAEGKVAISAVGGSEFLRFIE